MHEPTIGEGHVCSREWSSLAVCEKLWRLIGKSSLAFRTYPPISHVLQSVRQPTIRKMKSVGMPSELAELAASVLVQSMEQPFMEYWSSLQPQMLDTNIKQAAASIQRAGLHTGSDRPQSRSDRGGLSVFVDIVAALDFPPE